MKQEQRFENMELELRDVVLKEPVFVRRLDVKAEILGAIDRKPSLWLRVSGWGAAAMLVLCVGLSAFWAFSSNVVVIDAHSPRLVFLPDGTSIQGERGAVIAYNSATWLYEREVALRGDAYFDVSHGSRFVVNTPKGSIAVVGTKFSIASTAKVLLVQCYEGEVSVQYEQDLSSGKRGGRGRNGQERSVTLTRGQGVACTGAVVESFENPTPYYVSMNTRSVEQFVERIVTEAASNNDCIKPNDTTSSGGDSVVAALVAPIRREIVPTRVREVSLSSVTSKLSRGEVAEVVVDSVLRHQQEVNVNIATTENVASSFGSTLVYDFDNDRLVDVAAVIEGMFGVTIQPKSALEGMYFTGSFEGSSLEEALDIVMGSSGVKYRIRGSIVVVRR